jgi:hypothetical protein
MSYVDDASFGDFTCKHCGFTVSADTLYSGVIHRNHCPYCLWSRHLDLYKSGDRYSACKGLMKPVGLCLKKTYKKYAPLGTAGELMLVHQCLECGKSSINRIAADDDPDQVMRVYTQSLSLDSHIRNDLFRKDIILLEERHKKVIILRLFGSTR